MGNNTNEKAFDFDNYLSKCTDELRYILTTCASTHHSVTLNNLIGSIITSTDSIGNGTLLSAFAKRPGDYERLMRQYCQESYSGSCGFKDSNFEITGEVIEILEYAEKMYYKRGGVNSASVLCSIVRLKPDIMLSKMIGSCKESEVATPAVGYMNEIPETSSSSIRVEQKSSSIVTIPLNNLNKSIQSFVKQITYNSDLLVHRKAIEDRVMSIISKDHRPFVLLVGDAGCGKRSLVRAILDNLRHVAPSNKLYNSRAVEIDNMMMLDNGIVKMGQDKRMESTLSEIASKKNYITVINDIHMYEGINNPSGYSIYMALSGDWTPIIATATPEGLKALDANCSISKLFTIVNCSEPDKCFYKDVLRAHASHAGDEASIEVEDEVLDVLFNLNERYVGTIGMPGSLVDLLDTAIARCKSVNDSSEEASKLSQMLAEATDNLAVASRSGIEEYNKALYRKRKIEQMLKVSKTASGKNLTKEDLLSAVANKTGIDVSSLSADDRGQLSTIKSRFEKNVIGQEEAVVRVVNILKKMKLGLGNTNRTRGNILFVGPSGVGKTLVAKEVAKELFGDERAMLRIDMSEYSEKHSVSRLIGAPPGYVGYNNGGQLTSAIAAKSNCLILLDEIEKAHPDIFDVFLQVFDDGRLTDGRGKTVDFRNCFFIMTSNIGAKEVQDFGAAIGFDDSYDKSKRQSDIVSGAVKKHFKPEFVNRIDAIVNFNSLTDSDLKKITRNELDKFVARIEGAGYQVSVTDAVADFICKSMTDSERGMGARPIIRKIETMIEDKLADAIIDNEGCTQFVARVSRKRLEVVPQDSILD